MPDDDLIRQFEDDPLREAAVEIAAAIDRIDEYGSSRELALAKDKLREALFWIEQAQAD